MLAEVTLEKMELSYPMMSLAFLGIARTGINYLISVLLKDVLLPTETPFITLLILMVDCSSGLKGNYLKWNYLQYAID